VSDAPATIAQPTAGLSSAGEQAASTLFEPVSAIAPESRSPSREDLVEPGSHDILREATPRAPHEWVALESAVPLEGSRHSQQPTASRVSREVVNEAPSEAGAPIASDISPPRAEVETARPPQTAAVKPATTESVLEVMSRAKTPVETNKLRSGGERAAASRLRLPQSLPETDEDNGTPTLRVVPAATRSRDDRDTMARRPDRTTMATPRAPAGQGARGSSVEVRIGAVTLQVHAPAMPDAPQATVRSGFAPHRHYLRTW
jgi:hypothetical protein